jgi:subtilisin inhibitor-like
VRVALLLALSVVVGVVTAGVAAAPPPATNLIIRVYPGGVKKPQTAHVWTLACKPARGSLPNRADACQRLLALKAPFRPTPRNAVCTQIYGGPAVAHVSGTFKRQRVSRWFRRTNGCEIARWNRVRFLLRS